MWRPAFVRIPSPTLLAGAVSLCRDDFGDKVLELPDGRIAKLFRRKRRLSSNLFLPYARRFARAAARLRRRGVPTVEILGLYRLPDLDRDAVVYRKVEGMALREALAADPGRAAVLLPRLAGLLATLHERGVLFRSVHFGNWLVTPADPGRWTLIDILDTAFRPWPLGVGARVRNFRHLIRYRVDREALAAYGVERFVGDYAAAAGLPAARAKALRGRLARLDPFFAGLGKPAGEPVAGSTPGR
ncbi:MAG: hypothetical protein RJA22_2076 [Verrucomicrobiota bacterium]